MANTNPKALKRLYRELQQVAEDGQATGVEAWIIDQSNPFCLGASIRGAAGTPYHGGTFELLVNYPKDIGFYRPDIRFETFCFHPYVHAVTGAIGLSMLKDEWTPAWTLHAILLAIKSMLGSVFPPLYDACDVMNKEAGLLYRRSQAEFETEAQYWTEIMAIPVTVSRVCRILQVPEQENADAVLKALRVCDWNIVPAVLMFVETAVEVEDEDEQPFTVNGASMTDAAQESSLSAVLDDADGSTQMESPFALVPDEHNMPSAASPTSDSSFVFVPNEDNVSFPDLSRLSMDE